MFVTDAFSVCVVPTWTFPKLTLVGLTLRAAGETPNPLRPTLKLELVAVLLIVRLPDALPVAPGLKLTLRFVDCPGANVNGRRG